ncbi:helix-turn-helix domain-containing protein [Marinilabilia salmonicolor]|jgi:transcriptional regulator with XRE-family HTH domain|uniref:XRE family transcriptional regulator n=1 Tax=Marinilabilia salmonicolor TaxID=989 RepID=A0A2T0XMZ8_9BACT|nr:XRE family transcriptional regulator [Marinilabilia salmonicolor]PRZ00296.1 XRE family transcriptional regulator [Marinilabilia salmonicolor]RCW38412.1 XRE family transcriptional regulator [Marinilabilia salmonicolor]
MEEQIKQVATRIKDLREILNISKEEAADCCGITTAEYSEIESGKVDIPVGIMHLLAKKFRVDVTSFLSGSEPRMHYYTLTRKGQGVSVERRKAYNYRALAANFINRKADPFIVTVDPKSDDTATEFNSHPGQEFNLILKGSLKLNLNNKEMLLNEGDTIYFDASLPHGMKAANNEPCEFLAIIL